MAKHVICCDAEALNYHPRCYARLHPRAVNCRKKKCGHSYVVFVTNYTLCAPRPTHRPYLRPKKKIK